MIEVRVSENGMLAEIGIYPEEGEKIDVASIREALQLEGIQAGIEGSVIESMVKNEIYGEFIPVAKGKEVVNGIDGRYDYHFVTEEENKTPRIQEDGSVDYTKAITNVNEGDLLAEYHPRTTGSYGYNVFATMIAPVNGVELPPLLCKSVRKEENKYFAEKNGYVTMQGKTLMIMDVLDINGDVDQTVGDLDFNGDIRVHGSILSGMSVKAQGSVIVDGVIENAKVMAHKDILVGKGIHGQGETVIQAEGNLSANFIDHAMVSVDGDININYAVNSIIIAEGKVTAKGKHGSIVGGKVIATAGIEAERYGNDAEIPTKIYVGVSQKKQKQLQSCKKKLKELEEQIAGFKSNHVPELISRMLEDVKAEIWELENQKQGEKGSPIIIHSAIHPGVKCYLNDVEAFDISGRSGIELRNINSQVVCRRIRRQSAAAVKDPVAPANVEIVAQNKPRVLAIDDDVRMLRTINEMLKDDYYVSVTKSGQEARNFLEHKKVDLILLDYMMPYENGVEVLKSLRGNKDTAKIPVIFLTGLDDKKKILECLSLKPAGYVVKPVDCQKLLRKIKAVLGGAEQKQ